MGASQSFGPEGSKGTSGHDLAPPIFGQVAMVIPTAVHQRRDAGTSKSTGGQLPLVVRALAALSTNDPAAHRVIFIIARVALVTTVAIVPSHGVLAVPLTFPLNIAAVGANVVSLMAVIELIFGTPPFSTGKLASLFLAPEHHDSGIMSRQDDGWRLGRFLNNDLLGLSGTLTDDNWRWGWTGPAVELCLLSIVINVIPTGILKAVLDAALYHHVVFMAAMAGAAVLVVTFLSLEDGDAIAIRVPVVTLVVASTGTVVGRLEGRAWPFRAAVIVVVVMVVVVAAGMV